MWIVSNTTTKGNKSIKFISFCNETGLQESDSARIRQHRRYRQQTANAKSNTHERRMKKAFSGLQKDIFSLYRTILREAVKKDQQLPATASTTTTTATDETRIALPQQHPRIWELWQDPHTTSHFARQEFRKQAGLVKRNDFKTIEHKIRHGYKQVKLLQMPGVKIVGRPSS